MTKLTIAQETEFIIDKMVDDKDCFAILETVDCEKSTDPEYGTVDYLFSDNSILRYTVNETFVSLVKTW